MGGEAERLPASELLICMHEFLEEAGGQALEEMLTPLMDVAQSCREGYGQRVGKELMEQYLAVEELFNHLSEVDMRVGGRVSRHGKERVTVGLFPCPDAERCDRGPAKQAQEGAAPSGGGGAVARGERGDRWGAPRFTRSEEEEGVGLQSVGLKDELMVRLLAALVEPSPEAFSPLLLRLSVLTQPEHAEVRGGGVIET